MDLGQLRIRVAKNDRFVEAMQLAAFTQTCYKFARAAYSHGPICKDLKSNCAKKIVVFQQPSTINQATNIFAPGLTRQCVSTPVLDHFISSQNCGHDMFPTLIYSFAGGLSVFSRRLRAL